jgi:hypothetical protein
MLKLKEMPGRGHKALILGSDHKAAVTVRQLITFVPPQRPHLKKTTKIYISVVNYLSVPKAHMPKDQDQCHLNSRLHTNGTRPLSLLVITQQLKLTACTCPRLVL